jgi:hypothetical protein
VIKKPRERGHSPRWAAEPEKIINNNITINIYKKQNYCIIIVNLHTGMQLKNK